MRYLSIFIFFITICILFVIKYGKNRYDNILICVLLFTLFFAKINNQSEYFDQYESNIDKLYQIPTYMESVVNKSIDKLIDATKPDMSHANDINEMTYLSPEMFGDDPDISGKNDSADPDKYNLLISEYLDLDSVLQLIQNKYPNAYQAIMQN